MSKNNSGKEKITCVTLKGELEYLGKHVCISGITLCGCPTVDYDRKVLPNLDKGKLKDFPSEYTVEKWDITCERCLEMVKLFEAHKERKKTWN